MAQFLCYGFVLTWGHNFLFARFQWVWRIWPPNFAIILDISYIHSSEYKSAQPCLTKKLPFLLLTFSSTFGRTGQSWSGFEGLWEPLNLLYHIPPIFLWFHVTNLLIIMFFPAFFPFLSLTVSAVPGISNKLYIESRGVISYICMLCVAYIFTFNITSVLCPTRLPSVFRPPAN